MSQPAMYAASGESPAVVYIYKVTAKLQVVQ